MDTIEEQRVQKRLARARKNIPDLALIKRSERQPHVERATILAALRDSLGEARRSETIRNLDFERVDELIDEHFPTLDDPHEAAQRVIAKIAWRESELRVAEKTTGTTSEINKKVGMLRPVIQKDLQQEYSDMVEAYRPTLQTLLDEAKKSDYRIVRK